MVKLKQYIQIDDFPAAITNTCDSNLRTNNYDSSLRNNTSIIFLINSVGANKMLIMQLCFTLLMKRKYNPNRHLFGFVRDVHVMGCTEKGYHITSTINLL